jgi:hypothetical protein
MATQTTQFVATDESGIEREAAPSVEDLAGGNLDPRKITLRRNVLALSADLSQASAILADRAGEIVKFASGLPDRCGREETAARISAFIESLYPASSSLRSRRSFHSGLGEMIADRIRVNRIPWILALTTTSLLGLAMILIAK